MVQLFKFREKNNIDLYLVGDSHVKIEMLE